MNCGPNISIALGLISLIAGVWFLYKVQKENLSILFKVAAWFVIIVALGNMLCCGMRCCMHGCGMERECRIEMMRGGECEMGMGHCGMGMMGGGMCRIGGMNQMCMMGGGMNCCGMCKGESCEKGGMKCEEDEECDEMKEGKCCDKDKKECEMKMKKDSVVIKKK